MDTAQVEKVPISYGEDSLYSVDILHRGLTPHVSALGEQVKASELKPVLLQHPLSGDPAWAKTATTPDAELEPDKGTINEKSTNTESGTSHSGLFLEQVKERFRQILSKGN